MGVFDRSEREYKRQRYREAQRYLSEAKSEIAEGNRLIKNAKIELNSELNRAKSAIDKQYNYKAEAAYTLKCDIIPTVLAFEKCDINSKINLPPLGSVQSLSTNFCCSQAVIRSVDTILKDIIGFDLREPIISALSELFFSDDDYYAALNKRSEASNYKYQMKSASYELEAQKDTLVAMRKFINQEERLLKDLMNKVKHLSKELDGGIKAESLTQAEANQLRCFDVICKQIIILLQAEFLTDNGKISSAYRNVYDCLDRINNNLPYSPTISSVDWTSILQIANIT